MAIDTSPEGLLSELQRALEVRDAYLGENYKEALRRFTGPAYRSSAPPSDTDFENHAHSWLATFLPILASGNPRVRGKTPRLGAAAALSKAVELGINRNFELTDVKRTIEQGATFWAFKYAVALTTPTPVPGMMEREDPLHRPATKCLSLDDYAWDALGRQHAECRWQGHGLSRDKDSVLEEAAQFPARRWNVDAILALGEDKSDIRERRGLPTDIRRSEIRFWEILVHDHQLDRAYDARGKAFKPLPEKGYRGTIFTLSEDGRSFLREPRPFWGPPEGPYTFSGYLYVPDEVVPLAPLVATAAQAEEYNATLASAIQAIRKYKRGFAVSSSAASDLAAKIAEFEDLGVFTVDDIAGEIEKHLKVVEAGGLSNNHQVHIETLRFLLERASGLSEAQQGAVTGDATATEASIAQMSSGRRMGYMTEKFIQTFVKPIAKKEGWYLAADPRSRVDLGALAEGLFVDPKTGQPIEMPVLEGGPDNVNLLDENDIEIQPISMRFTTEMLEAERTASWEQFLLATAPMIPSLPYVDWGLVYSRKAEQLGDPALARTIDLPKAMFLGQLQLMATMGMVGGQMGAQPTQTQPRLGIDMKGAKSTSPAPALKASEKPGGFSANARPGGNAKAQTNKAPRAPGTSASTKG